MKLIKYLILSLFVSFSLGAWENKEEFDVAFKASVNGFLERKGMSFLLMRDFPDFIETHEKFLKQYHKFCTLDPKDPNSPWLGVMHEMPSFAETGLNNFDTLFCVGPQKPLSNLPTETFIKDQDIKQAIEKWAKSVKYETFTDAEPGQPGGALWLFAPLAMEKLLTENKDLLAKNNVSQDPIQFIKDISKTNDEGQTAFGLDSNKPHMYQLIARAFGREVSLEEIDELVKQRKAP